MEDNKEKRLKPGDWIKVTGDKDAREILKGLGKEGYGATRVSGNYIRITRAPAPKE